MSFKFRCWPEFSGILGVDRWPSTRPYAGAREVFSEPDVEVRMDVSTVDRITGVNLVGCKPALDAMLRGQLRSPAVRPVVQCLHDQCFRPILGQVLDGIGCRRRGQPLTRRFGADQQGCALRADLDSGRACMPLSCSRRRAQEAPAPYGCRNHPRADALQRNAGKCADPLAS